MPTWVSTLSRTRRTFTFSSLPQSQSRYQQTATAMILIAASSPRLTWFRCLTACCAVASVVPEWRWGKSQLKDCQYDGSKYIYLPQFLAFVVQLISHYGEGYWRAMLVNLLLEHHSYQRTYQPHMRRLEQTCRQAGIQLPDVPRKSRHSARSRNVLQFPFRFNCLTSASCFPCCVFSAYNIEIENEIADKPIPYPPPSFEDDEEDEEGKHNEFDIKAIKGKVRNCKS